MNQALFTFSTNYKILTADELKSFDELDLSDIGGQAEWKKIHNEEAFVVSSSDYKYQYIINPVIKFFLEHFIENPISFPNVLNQISTAVNATESQVAPIVEPFFRTMVEQGILEFYEPNNLEENISDNVNEFLFEIGEVVKSYQIKSLIAQKKFVEIYLATDLNSSTSVVIKIMRYAKIFEPELEEQIAYFKQEFEMMRQLSHPNLCGFVDFYSDENQTFGVMQYVEGESPRKILKKRKLRLEDKRYIFQQMLNAVAYMHKKGLTHGDLHAGNFMVTAENKVVLIDFGFTHHVEAKADELSIEGGTMAYLPPECVNDNIFEVTTQRVDFQGEVYQLGVIGYILFYETKPFRGLTWKQLCHAILTEIPTFEPFTPNNEFIPSKIRNTLKKAMQKNVKKRFKNAIEMGNFLD